MRAKKEKRQPGPAVKESVNTLQTRESSEFQLKIQRFDFEVVQAFVVAVSFRRSEFRLAEPGSRVIC